MLALWLTVKKALTCAADDIDFASKFGNLPLLAGSASQRALYLINQQSRAAAAGAYQPIAFYAALTFRASHRDRPRDTASFRELAGFIWSVADLLRGD